MSSTAIQQLEWYDITPIIYTKIISNANSIKILYYDISLLRSLTYATLLDTTIQQQTFDTQHQTII